MNKQAELTRWTPKRLLSLLMALIMTLSLLPTAALADATEVGNGETYTFDPTIPSTSNKVIKNPDGSSTVVMPINAVNTLTQIADGYIDESKSLWGLKFSIGQFSVDKPGNTIEATVDAYLTLKGSTNAEITEVSVTDDKTGSGWGHRADTTRTGNITVGEDGCARFTISVTYKVNGTDTYTKSAHVVIMSLWTGYNVTFTAPAGLTGVTFTGLPSTTAKTVAKDASSDDYEQVYTIPAGAKASKDGYTFKGWDLYREGSLSILTQPDTTITGIDGDIQLAAHLEENQDIFFNPVYSGVSGLPYGYKDISQGQTYTIPYTPELSGYDFKGWTVTGATLEADGVSVKNITSQITITPIWEKSDGSAPVGSHTVKFVRRNTTDGSASNWPNDLTGAAGDTVTIPWNIPQAEGYTFLGWSTDQNATTANYHPNDTVTITDTDISLYAVWQAKNYTITYTPNDSLTGVTLTNTASSITPGTLASFNVKVDAKYDASSMIVAANGVPLGYSTKTENNDGSTTYTYSFVPTGDTAVTVSQPEQKSYVVTLPVGDHFTAKFDDIDKSDKTVTYNGSVSFTVTADSGWTIEAVSYTGDATLTRDTTDLTKYTLTDIKSNVAVSVKMKQIPVYTISYSIDEAYFTSQKVTGESANVTLITPAERTGYNFDGWYKNPDYTDKAEATLTVTGDVNLYGHYKPITKSISYDMNAPQDANGNPLTVAPTSLLPTEKTYGQAVTLSAVTPTCDSYDFLGWAKEENKGLVVYAAGATVSEELTADMTLYAVWAKKTYTITLQGGSGYTVSSNQALVVEHGSDFTFTVTVDGAYAATMPTVTANGATPTKVSGEPNAKHEAATYTYTISNVTADQVVTVKVTENARATVTFQYRVVDAQGNEVTVTGLSGETFMTQAVQLGDPAAQPQQPNIEGYKFVRWCGADHTTATHEAYDFTKPVAGPLTIYAEITPILPVITVTDALNGTGWKTENWKHGAEGTETNAAITNNAFTIAYGDNVTFDLVIAKGYDYSKLSVTANGLALGYQSATTDEKTGSTTLHYYLGSVMADTRIAITGIERKTITITYNANARDDVSGMPTPEKVKYYLTELGESGNDKITTQIPSRTGYEFVGWCTDSEATVTVNETTKTIESDKGGVVVNPGSTAPFTQDTTLYAIWLAQDTTLTLNITDVALKANDTRVIQYEGESITLQATLNVGAKGTIEFYKAATSGETGTKIGSTTVNGMTAELSVKVGEYKTTAKDEYYYAIFKSEADEGYADSAKSNKMNVGIFSKAICWVIGEATASELLVYKGNGATGTPITDAMIAGQTYTLKVKTDKITGVETLDSKKPVLGKDYKIVWQYYEVDKNDWTTVTESSDKATYLVTGEYSGYQFRAQIVPLGKDHDSLYLKAAKYDDTGLLKDQYDVCLYTKPTAATTRQTTATALAITGAENEAANVTINGATDVFTDAHLAQFEGQKVTLTATVTDTTTHAGVKSGEVKFFRYVDGTSDELLNTTLIGVDSNGVATCEVEISKWTDGKSVTENKDEFYAVYQPNATYDTSDSKTTPQTVYIKSTTIQTPIIESTLPGKLNGADANSTSYEYDLTGLLAGVEHTFKLRTGNDKADWSVVALDGRTVAAENYTIQWITKSGDNAETTAATGSEFMTSDNKVGNEIYVRLNPTGDMKTGADSKKAIIDKKQDVTVAVEASDEIASTPVDRAAKKFPDVYQLNEIELTATVKGYDSETMTPTGTVKFYYKDRQVTPNTFVYLGEAALAKGTDGKMHASIKTDKLPVDKDNNTKLDVVVCAAYFGDDTFAASRNVNATTGNIAYAGSTGYVTYDTVTVYSSVVYAGDSENKATTTPSTDGITITANGKLKANEAGVTLTLGQVYTLDHPIDLSKLTYNTDYTVQWQILENALQHQDSGSAGSYTSTTAWKDLQGQTGMNYTGTMEQDAAYRAKITVKDTPIAKGSFTEVTQTNPGRKVYYSNVLVVGAGMATVTTNITTSANQNFNEEGIVSGETATIHVLASGAAKTTPISTVTATITNGASETVFNEKANNVNGYTSFAWDTAGLTPGYYTLTVTAESNNGYAPQTITRTLIVRDNAYTLKATKESKVYNGKAQGIDWELTGVDIENALAQKSVVVYYYDKDGKMVEPTQAGKYQYDLYLPASAYWTELTHVSGTFIIEKRPVEVVDLVAQAKVYDGTTNANIQEIILNDAEVNSTTGLPTDDKGIIDGDSVYAVGTGYTSKDTAGTADLGVKNVTLMGDDAANYVLVNSGHTEEFNIQRSQVKGAIVSGRTYKYTGKDIKLAASDIYLIDQAGSQLTDYDVTYYYHNGDGVEKVDAMNKMGKYTVIARPEQNNYKGGATETVYVGNTDTPGTLNNGAKSSLITISNTVELYGARTGVTVSATKGTATASYYYDGAWKDTAPTNAGRYLVKATVTNDGVTDTAYGIYTIVKARPEFTPTTDKPIMEYTSGRYDGTVDAGLMSGSTAETYITYTGGTIQGVAYEAPTEVGKYIATVHVGETANYTAHEKQVAFEITPKALTITADDLQRWQYGSFPDMVASYQGLATKGIAADTSLRDVQIQPEFLFNEQNGGYTNHAFDQVGTYPVTVRNALARNYTVTYVGGTIATTAEEPKAELAIHGMPDNGTTTTENLVYYGDTIQLYAYGYYKTLDSNTSGGSYNTSSLIEWSVSDASIAEIDQSGLLTIKGVGTFTVTLTRGSGSAAISTTINVTAKKQEVKVVVPDQDLIYNGAEQKYDGGKFYAENAKGERITATPYMHDGKVKRTNVGSQIITSWVGDTNATYQSEHYCGLFTINVRGVTVTPIEATTPYGTAATGLTHTESNTVGGVAALTGPMAVSVADAYSNLDVLNGYEILVAGRENENYNVKYVTDQDAPDVEVTAKDLTIKTGTLNEQTGMTSGSLNPMGKYPVNGAAIDDPAPAMGPSNVRMYGEPNWVMDKDPVTLISGDTLADLAALNDKLVSFNYNIGADANVSYTDKTTKLTVSGSPMPDYKVFTDNSKMAFKNYTETYTLGTQNIYQRPVTLSVPSGMTLTAYKPSILDSSNQVKNDVLLNLLLNNLIVSKYNNEGGLAELLKHTIKDLNIQIKSTQVTGDKLTVKIALGNQNYWLNSANEQTFEITLVTEKIVPKYSTLDWTSFSVTMYDAEGKAPVSVNGAVNFYIFKKKDGADLKYSDYKNDPIIRSGPMTPTGSTGQYVASFERLPAGEYAYFAIAQNYTIVE